MNEGKIQQAAPPLEVYNQPANRFVAGFIGSPAMNFLELSVDGHILVDKAADIAIPLPDRLRAQLGASRHAKVVLGVRPEGLRPADRADVVPTNAATFVVEVVQHLGHETLLDAAIGSHRIVARVPPTDNSTIGERRPFVFAMDMAQLFDLETGAKLGLPQ